MYTVVNVNIHKNTKGNKSNGIQAIVLYYVHKITVSVNRLTSFLSHSAPPILLTFLFPVSAPVSVSYISVLQL